MYRKTLRIHSEETIAMSQPIHISDAEFDAKVLKAALPVVVDFWAPWCMPCRAIAPALERLAVEFSEKVTFAKVDTDENPEYAQRYGVQGIPTLLFLRKGKEVNRIVGTLPETALREAVRDLLAKDAASSAENA
jgi:thioredoxin 1